MKKQTHVFLGRFSPFHKGHRMLLERMIEEFGIENCLVLIGSSNVMNDRTPYTFDERKRMLLGVNEKLSVLPFPDVNDDEIWLDNLKKLEKKMGTKFIFYGGSLEDLKTLSHAFETNVLVDRHTEGGGISATKIRENLKKH